MDTKIKAEWVEALRGGDYAQAKSCLRDGNSFCCLGVLCDILKDRVGGMWSQDEDGFVFVAGDGSVGRSTLPARVCTTVGIPVFSGDEKADGEYLSTHNDNGKSFTEIADLIERHM